MKAVVPSGQKMFGKMRVVEGWKQPESVQNPS
jgi:hypothetical protein